MFGGAGFIGLCVLHSHILRCRIYQGATLLGNESSRGKEARGEDRCGPAVLISLCPLGPSIECSERPGRSRQPPAQSAVPEASARRAGKVGVGQRGLWKMSLCGSIVFPWPFLRLSWSLVNAEAWLWPPRSSPVVKVAVLPNPVKILLSAFISLCWPRAPRSSSAFYTTGQGAALPGEEALEP